MTTAKKEDNKRVENAHSGLKKARHFMPSSDGSELTRHDTNMVRGLPDYYNHTFEFRQKSMEMNLDCLCGRPLMMARNILRASKQDWFRWDRNADPINKELNFLLRHRWVYVAKNSGSEGSSRLELVQVSSSALSQNAIT